MFFGIDFSDEWESVTSISKGWSSDKKYLVVTRTGEKLLLRISDIEQYEAKQKEYDIICRYSRCDLEMSRPLAFGICNDGKSNIYGQWNHWSNRF